MFISRKAIVAFMLMLGGVIINSQAEAMPILDFGVVAPTSGTISYAGGNAPLKGTHIQVDNVAGLMTPINNGNVFVITGGELNFTTDNLTGSTQSAWNFGGGSSSAITITGGIDLNSDNDFTDPGEIPIGTVLLRGSFSGVTVSRNPVGGIQTFKIAGAAFTDFKNEMLLDLFGLPKTFPSGDPLPYSGNFNISFLAPGSPPGAFESILVTSGDILNTPVPEPTSFLLLGSGLAGIFFHGRKKRTR